MVFDLLPVGRRNERAHARIRVGAVADVDGLHAGREGFDEGIVNGRFDQQLCARRTDLAGVKEHRVERVVDGDVEVGVGEDDVGILAPEFQGHPLQVAGSGPHDGPAGLTAARERQKVDAMVFGQLGADGGAGAQHGVDDAVGKTDLFAEFGQT